MKADKIFLSDEESQNAEDNTQRLADIMDIFYSVIRVAALTPKSLNEPGPGEKLAIGIFGMFLKTILADLRSVHVLVSIGYPLSAATVASSLWEKSVMGRFILKSPGQRIQTYFEHPSKKKLPWDMKSMLLELIVENDPATKAKAVDLYYVQFTYLCSLKHPQAETISKASELHFDQSRSMELIPGKPSDSRGLNFLILAQALYSTLEYMNFAVPMFCKSDLVNVCTHLSGKLGRLCFADNLTLQVPPEFQLRPGDVSPEAWEHLRNFWSSK
jgi:hypothetical protein